jgi:hypothetical protein
VTGRKFVSSEFDRLSGDAPQFFSGVPQSTSEHGKYNCEDAGNCLTVVVEKIDDRNEGQEKRTGEGRAFLILLSVAAAAGICSYWMARYQR